MSILIWQQRLHYWWALRRLAYKPLAALLAAALLAAAVKYYANPIGRQVAPLRVIEVEGGTAAGHAAARALLKEAHGGNLMSMDVREWQEKLQALPGIARAEVTRQLPHTLQVILHASQPLARWTDGTLIDSRGKRFSGSADMPLPVFRGDWSEAARIAAFYQQANEILPNEIAQVELGARGGWQVFLTGGILLRLGRQPEAQLRRYVRHARALQKRLPALRVVDLRYKRGFAVQVHNEEGRQS